jgi:hypothetical protein
VTRTEFVGLALVAVAAYHLIPAFTTGTIPTRRKGRPLRQAAKPEEYRITFGVFMAAAVVGLGILLAALLKRAGL